MNPLESLRYRHPHSVHLVPRNSSTSSRASPVYFQLQSLKHGEYCRDPFLIANINLGIGVTGAKISWEIILQLFGCHLIRWVQPSPDTLRLQEQCQAPALSLEITKRSWWKSALWNKSAMIGKANFAHFAKEASHCKSRNKWLRVWRFEYDFVSKVLQEHQSLPLFETFKARLEHPHLWSALARDRFTILTRIHISCYQPWSRHDFNQNPW